MVGMPETLAGLPLHPLVVHAVVVLLPLSALGAILLVAVPRWRRGGGPLVLIGLALSAGAAWVAKESGETLAAEVGLPQEHAEWGDRLVPIALALLVAFAAWWLRARRGIRGTLTAIAAIVTVTVSLAAVGATILTGHSGAEAVWGGRLEAAGGIGASVAAPAGGDSITLDEVAQHATPLDCWAAIDGTVYDLTSWIDRHPGGPEVVIAMCGTDATEAFAAAHEGQGEPAERLAQLEVGVVAGG